ncbi:MAG: hypothetical protein ACLP0J_05155 [Solirubrobacteraceae bacterium]
MSTTVLALPPLAIEATAAQRRKREPVRRLKPARDAAPKSVAGAKAER